MSSSWWEVSILCDPQFEELLFWKLDEFGCRGMATESRQQNLLIKGYVPQIQAQLLDLSALALTLRQLAIQMTLPEPQVQWKLIDEEDWSSSWKENWQPQPIGDRFLIYPAWLELPPEPSDRTLLRLDPGVAFGTGNHPTTQLCLEALEMRLSYDADKAVIADIGCGSGILSIGAILLGAQQVYAVDTDPLAVKAARSNRELNGISSKQMPVKKGSLDYLSATLFDGVDGIVCNILAEVIIDLIPQMSEICKPDSWGILSGILFEQVKPIADTLEQNGWVVATLWKNQDWCCFNIRRH